MMGDIEGLGGDGEVSQCDLSIARHTVQEIVIGVLRDSAAPLSIMDVYWASQRRLYAQIVLELETLVAAGEVEKLAVGRYQAAPASAISLARETQHITHNMGDEASGESSSNAMSAPQEEVPVNQSDAGPLGLSAAEPESDGLVAEHPACAEPDGQRDEAPSTIPAQSEVEESGPSLEVPVVGAIDGGRTDSTESTIVAMCEDAVDSNGVPLIELLPGHYLSKDGVFVASAKDDARVLPVPSAWRSEFAGHTVKEIVALYGGHAGSWSDRLETALKRCASPLTTSLNPWTVGALQCASGSKRFVFDQFGCLRYVPNAAEAEILPRQIEWGALLIRGHSLAPIDVLSLDPGICQRLTAGGIKHLVALVTAPFRQLTKLVGQDGVSEIELALKRYSGRRLGLGMSSSIVNKVAGFSRIHEPVHYSSLEPFFQKFSDREREVVGMARSELEKRGLEVDEQSFAAFELPYTHSGPHYPHSTMLEARAVMQHTFKMCGTTLPYRAVLRRDVSKAVLDAQSTSEPTVTVSVREEDKWEDAAQWLSKYCDAVFYEHSNRKLVVKVNVSDGILAKSPSGSERCAEKDASSPNEKTAECADSVVEEDVSTRGNNSDAPISLKEALETLRDPMLETLNAVCAAPHLALRTRDRYKEQLSELYLLEDMLYGGLRSKYHISKYGLIKISGSVNAARYLSVKYEPGNRSLNEALNDQDIPEETRKKLAEYINESDLPYVNEDRKKPEATVSKSGKHQPSEAMIEHLEERRMMRGPAASMRASKTDASPAGSDDSRHDGSTDCKSAHSYRELVRTTLEQYANQKPITLREFREKYDERLRLLHLGGRMDLRLPGSAANLANSFKRSSFALVSRGGTVRYFLWRNLDTQAMRKMLHEASGFNMECSCSVLFEKYPELMQGCDVRTAEELHTVLKYVCDGRPIRGVDFGVNPIIKLGACDRGRQLVDLVKELAPISRRDYIQEYSRRYGVQPATIAASYLPVIKAYEVNGRYEYSRVHLTTEQEQFLSSLLHEDCLTLANVRLQFSSKYPDAPSSAITGEVLSAIGFRVSQGLIVRSDIDEAEYFRRMISSRDTFTCGDRGFSEDVFSHSAFMSALIGKVRAHEYVEISHRSYVSVNSLREALGFGKAGLDDYSRSVMGYAKQSIPFTIHSLGLSGFIHPLDALRERAGFGDCFYESVLESEAGRLKRTTIGGKTVFCITDTSFSTASLVEYIIERDGSLEVEELGYKLHDEFGISLSDAALKRIIQSADLFFGEQMGLVCKNREQYRLAMLSYVRKDSVKDSRGV